MLVYDYNRNFIRQLVVRMTGRSLNLGTSTIPCCHVNFSRRLRRVETTPTVGALVVKYCQLYNYSI